MRNLVRHRAHASQDNVLPVSVSRSYRPVVAASAPTPIFTFSRHVPTTPEASYRSAVMMASASAVPFSVAIRLAAPATGLRYCSTASSAVPKRSAVALR